MLCQLWYPSQRTGHQDLDSQIPCVLSGHLRWWWAGINKQLEAIKFLIICKVGHHAWFPTPLWVILSLPMKALLPSPLIPTPCWVRQLSAGRQSLTRGAPPRQKDFLIIMSLHCVYIGLHLNIYEMIITPVVDGYERYELFVNAVESTLHGILHGVEKWWELLWKWMKESKWKTNTKIAKPFVQISLILSHHK